MSLNCDANNESKSQIFWTYNVKQRITKGDLDAWKKEAKRKQ